MLKRAKNCIILGGFYDFWPHSMHTINYQRSNWIGLAAFLGLIAVIIGAVAAHAVADPKAVAALEKAALYQLIHAAVLLFVCGLTGRSAQISRWLLLAGIVMFCGSIELKYLLNVQGATAVAPLGGVCLMLGWISLGIAGVNQPKDSAQP